MYVADGYTRFLSPNGRHVEARPGEPAAPQDSGQPVTRRCTQRRQKPDRVSSDEYEILILSLGRADRIPLDLVEPSTVYEGAGCGQYGTIGFGGFRYKRVAMIDSPSVGDHGIRNTSPKLSLESSPQGPRPHMANDVKLTDDLL